MSGVIATLLAQRRPAQTGSENEATLELSSSFAVAGQKLLETAGRLQLMFENELVPDEMLDLNTARRWIEDARKSLAAYDVSRQIAKGRAAMARDNDKT